MANNSKSKWDRHLKILLDIFTLEMTWLDFFLRGLAEVNKCLVTHVFVCIVDHVSNMGRKSFFHHSIVLMSPTSWYTNIRAICLTLSMVPDLRACDTCIGPLSTEGPGQRLDFYFNLIHPGRVHLNFSQAFGWSLEPF